MVDPAAHDESAGDRRSSLAAPGPARIGIRPARPDDAEAISAFAREVLAEQGRSADDGEELPPFLHPDAILFRLQRGSLCLVAWLEGRLAGVIEIEELKHVTLLAVAPELRQRGLARALWEQALGFCREYADGPLSFSVLALPSACEVYRRFGFRESGPPERHHGLVLVPMVRAMMLPGDPGMAGESR